jgi:hypothetical protein
MFRGVKSMQAMSAPLMTFLMENHAVTPGDKMPYGDELLGKLREIVNAKTEPNVRNGDVLDHQTGTPAPGPASGDEANHTDRDAGSASQ